jgi:hypothetical protein
MAAAEAMYTRLPPTLFQLLDILLEYPDETTVIVNQWDKRYIAVHLTKGVEGYTDYKNEPIITCGMHIHTHPYRLPQRNRTREEHKLWPPSGFDFRESVKRVIVSSYTNFDYAYDGQVLWYYKANANMKKEILTLVESGYSPEDLLSVVEENADNNASRLVNIHPYDRAISLEEYMVLSKDIVNERATGGDESSYLGMEIGFVRRSTEPFYIPDNIQCDDIRDKFHFLFPIDSLLMSDDELKDVTRRIDIIFDEQSHDMITNVGSA